MEEAINHWQPVITGNTQPCVLAKRCWPSWNVQVQTVEIETNFFCVSKYCLWIDIVQAMKQEGGGVSQVNIGWVITASMTSRHTSMIFDMKGNVFLSLTQRYGKFSNVLMFRLLYSRLPRIQNRWNTSLKSFSVGWRFQKPHFFIRNILTTVWDFPKVEWVYNFYPEPTQKCCDVMIPE